MKNVILATLKQQADELRAQYWSLDDEIRSLDEKAEPLNFKLQVKRAKQCSIEGAYSQISELCKLEIGHPLTPIRARRKRPIVTA